MKTYVRKTDTGKLIGDSHPNAILSDTEVEQLLQDREAGLTYRQLMVKYGASKSTVAMICRGERRGRVGQRYEGKETKGRKKSPRVRVNLVISLHTRAQLHRLGGGKWVEQMVQETMARKERVHDNA